jgi:hypothetical protein
MSATEAISRQATFAPDEAESLLPEEEDPAGEDFSPDPFSEPPFSEPPLAEEEDSAEADDESAEAGAEDGDDELFLLSVR